MADIPGNIQKLQIEETDFNSPVSEQLNTKFGASINGLIDLVTAGFTVFTSNGTYQPPTGTTRVLIFGCGGGQGGSATPNVGAIDQFDPTGGFGGAGAVPDFATVTVNDATTYNITIGAGGAGTSAAAAAPDNVIPGLAGGQTLFGTLLVYYGATGIRSGNPDGSIPLTKMFRHASLNGPGDSITQKTNLGNLKEVGLYYPDWDQVSYTMNGLTYTAGGIPSTSGVGGAGQEEKAFAGVSSRYGLGGFGGGVSGTVGSAPGGGGGGAGFGVGGLGGTNGNGGAAPANTGSGGGGAGATGFSGGAGGSGFLAVRPI